MFTTYMYIYSVGICIYTDIFIYKGCTTLFLNVYCICVYVYITRYVHIYVYIYICIMHMYIFAVYTDLCRVYAFSQYAYMNGTFMHAFICVSDVSLYLQHTYIRYMCISIYIYTYMHMLPPPHTPSQEIHVMYHTGKVLVQVLFFCCHCYSYFLY